MEAELTVTRDPDRLARVAEAAEVAEVAEVQELAEVRERAASRPGEGDRGSGLLLGGGVVVVALSLAGVGLRLDPPPSGPDLPRLALLVGLYALAYRTEVKLTAGGAVPTQPVLVGLLLTCPPYLAPLAVLVGLHLAEGPPAAGGAAPQRLRGIVVRSAGAWSVVAPAVVLWAFAPGAPAWADAPVYLLALGAQFALDATVALARAAALSVAPRVVLPGLLWTFAVDSLLAPIGLCVVLAADGADWPLVLLLAPVGLVRLLARDRERQLDRAISIGAAFDSVQEQARRDALTGLANRRAWQEALDGAAAGVPVGVLMADVDGLKRVNDEAGHLAGDALIREIAGVLVAAVPPGCLVARLGGDEFGVLVPLPADGSGELPAALTARLRTRMAVHPGVSGHALSCSLGWAATPPEPTVDDAVQRADALARQDKARRRAGRECHEQGRPAPDRRLAERRRPLS